MDEIKTYSLHQWPETRRIEAPKYIILEFIMQCILLSFAFGVVFASTRMGTIYNEKFEKNSRPPPLFYFFAFNISYALAEASNFMRG